MTGSLAGRSIVVLGGTSALGRTMVERLARHGAYVTFQGRDEAAAAGIADACRGLPGRVLFRPANLMDYEEVRGVYLEAEAAFGKVDVSVCSGGSLEPGPMLFKDMTVADMIACTQSRLIPRLNGLKAASEVMIPRGYGKVILITTDAGRTPTPTETIIGATGAFLIHLTRAAGSELARNGIRINAVALSLTAGTSAYDRLTGPEAENVPAKAKVFRKIRDRASFGLADPDDIAAYVHYLASPESDRVSGSTLSINGGVSFPGY